VQDRGQGQDGRADERSARADEMSAA
jgi:hypothetical protein